MARHAPPVFVDPTGRRARRVRLLAGAATTATVTLLGMVVLGLTGGGSLPDGGWLPPEQPGVVQPTPRERPDPASARAATRPAAAGVSPTASLSDTGAATPKPATTAAQPRSPGGSPTPADPTGAGKRPSDPPGQGSAKPAPSRPAVPSPGPR